jgi:hypothetical protein
MLPHGMYLHKMYDNQKFHSVVKLSPTNMYIQRKNLISEQEEGIKDQRKKMQLSLIEKRKGEKAALQEKKEKFVPIVAQSAKFITTEKKEYDKA